MSESTASRIDRVGREQRREERQRTSTSGSSASSNLVSSTSFTSSSSPNQSPIAPKSGSQNEHQMSCTNEDNNGEDPDSTSTFEQENIEGAGSVRVVTNLNRTPQEPISECTSSQEVDDKLPEEFEEGTYKVDIKDRDQYRTVNCVTIDNENHERINQRIDPDCSDDDTDGASYAPLCPSNFMSSHTKNSNVVGIPLRNNDNTSSETFVNEAAGVLDACSLGEVPPSLREQNSLQRLHRSLDSGNDWQKDNELSAESNKYPWPRRTLDDESCIAANISQYPIDAEIGSYSTHRNVNLIEVNAGAGHSTASGRKTKNRESTPIETDHVTTDNRNASENSADNQRSQSIVHDNSEEDVPFSLERASSLKSVKPKSRRNKLSTSTSQSNIPGRSDSPSPSRKNVSNLNSKSKHNSKSSRSANVGRSSSPTESQPEFRDSESANAMRQNPVQNALGLLPHYNWQATKMTVKERLAFLFNNNILSDVTFVVGRDVQQQRIPAHRFVLSVGSAVFDAMFNRHSSKTGSSAIEEDIELPDVEPASFLALLRFLYSDEVQIGPETVMTTLYTAKKYAVPALEKHCVDFLKRHLCADNAFMLLTQARLFDEPQLAALCLETIDKATPEALAAEGFTDIDIDTLSAVLDRDSLRIKEAKLFSAVLRWSEAECLRQSLPSGSAENKRSVLGRVLRQIRFPLMTVEEFAQGPAQSGILTDRECVSLFLHFTVNPKPPVAFMDIPRCSMTGKEQTVCRFQQIESRWGYSGTSDKIRFIVDRRIFVVGFGLYGSIHGPSEYQVNIQIIHTGSGRLLGSNEISFSSDGTNGTFRVMFKEPIEIQHNTNYTASATLKGLDSHYGTKGLRKVSVECPTGGKVTFQFSYAAGNNNGTSVEDGQIPEIIFYT